MCPDRSVNYAEVWDDYAYFLAHSTETSSQIVTLRPHLAWMSGLGGPRRLLDFGCGDGSFLARLAGTLGFSPDRVELCIVEPRKALRDLAAQRLTEHGLCAGAHAEIGSVSGHFDVVLANHSLYYVPDLLAVTQRLVDILCPSGRMIVALLDRQNALARVWQAGFGNDPSGFPFNLAEDFIAVLRRLGLKARREIVAYRIDFPDTIPSLRHVLRFLFGDHLETMPESHARSLFDPYRQGDRIVMSTEYPCLVVQKAEH